MTERMNVAQQILVFGVRLYQLTLSPAKMFVFGAAGQCRFSPSCSEYALEAVLKHGALKGSWLALKRVCRCHPWGGCGCDPVPAVVQSSKFKGSELTHQATDQASRTIERKSSYFKISSTAPISTSASH